MLSAPQPRKLTTRETMVARASVKFYDADKSFGFVRVLDANGRRTGEELFFHLLAACNLIDGEDSPEFKVVRGRPDGSSLQRTPEANDILVIEEGYGNRGRKVQYWNYADEYDSVAQRLAQRPVYRVVKRATYYNAPESVSVVWEGQDIYELSATHYKEEPEYGRRHGYDSLDFGHADGSDMQWFYDFERQQEDGSWAETDDPRVFLCCVPEAVYRQHGPRRRQSYCVHGNR